MNRAKQLTPKQEERRHRILSATRDMVAKHGFEGMVMSQVAESAGVSPTTLYNLYNTKDELLLEALRDLLVDNYVKVGDESVGHGWRYLLNVVRNGAWLANSEPEYAEAITNSLMRASKGDALIKLLMTDIQQDFHYSLRSMEKEGELLAGLNLEELATILLGNYWSSFMLKGKRLVAPVDLDRQLSVNLLSFLESITQGQAKADISSELSSFLIQGN